MCRTTLPAPNLLRRPGLALEAARIRRGPAVPRPGLGTRGTRPVCRGLSGLLHELIEVRSRGYALSIGRTEPELAAVGASVGTLANGASFALSLSATSFRAGDLQGTTVVSLFQVACGRVRNKLDSLGFDPAS
ncbi:IclR family transcriptional regulator C-terminal domain-containing protein [Arthrobacter sp. UCD-GKA]|uniref:IclR family transcriptional regulator C-terminal domain-containing protein n=1 Tax=Arthrobacter sp. UCD-GKA TaxID=1913576 RepID=UPI001113F34A|nr:IclR family transcriptional regulator C-terminal domain-containing protein [Arthrobacter sp. UCD-GKA]